MALHFSPRSPLLPPHLQNPTKPSLLSPPLRLSLSAAPANPSRPFASPRLALLRPVPSFAVSDATDFAAVDGDGEDLAGSPWEGAVVYRRDAAACHVEYGTTLERLGLGKLSSPLSRSRASAMGIRLPPRGAKAPSPIETPVLVSVDVARRKRRLRLDGIVRTVITLGCNRCAEPAAECVFSNFALLLSEDPIKEPEEINMGTLLGEDRAGDNDDESIDIDDQLYFPAEVKEIDISKHIRDIVHVEITINAVCDVNCKGLCLRCGTNLNRSSCSCGKEMVPEKGKGNGGPLKELRKQMQQKYT
ncbi:uncharacterized protein LOC109727374 [Ananas comosus]|uniref:Uncharacterized protein LOC109727374 n=1 Tax=Ananas comosus TaxID=4615 RepID=A0A6P5GZ34_ANACO|nr:uncharacterized protein LOC109727374 [Ananas comosus]